MNGRVALAILCLTLLTATKQPCLAQAFAPAEVRPKLLVVLIGGMDSDPTPAQINRTARRHEGNSGLYRLMGDLRHDQIATMYFNWNGTPAGQIQSKSPPGARGITTALRTHLQSHPTCRIVIVGNSWGGHTTLQVCHEIFQSPEPFAVDSVVFLDPSSTGRTDTDLSRKLPVNIVHSVNYYTRNLFGWRKLPHDARVTNIDLGDRQNGFLSDGGPAYDSSFNFEAHVAAEWDEKIHLKIREHILDHLTISK